MGDPLAERVAQDAAREANQHAYRSPRTTREYVADPYHALRRQLAVEALLEGLESGRAGTAPVLEIGAGAQPMLNSIDGLSHRTIAADLSMDTLRVLKHEQHQLVCLDANKPLPFADGSTAAVLIGELIEHIFRPERSLREVSRILQPQGTLVLTTPNLATLHDRIAFLGGREPRQVNPLHPYLHLHIRPMTKRLLRRLLDDAGLELVGLRSNYVGFLMPSGRWRHVRWLARIAPSLGGSLVVLARKRTG